MNEIDDIILQSLRHIGCTFVDDDADEASTNAAAGAAASSPTAAAAADGRITRLADLPAGALLRCVVRCLQLIQPEHPSTAALPAGMPAGMAQRFAATSAVAEACTASGFTGDIGYQTFLYSNEADVRRVLMHLVERLPKDATSAKAKAAAAGTGGPAARLRALERSVARSVRLQLDAAWTPEYCKKNGIVRFKAAADDDDDYDEDDAPNGALLALQSSAHAFRPHRLNIAHPTRTFPEPPCAALRDYWAKRSPTLFQQTHGAHLCASLLHRNDADRLSELEPESDGAATDLEQDGRFERLLAVRRGHGSGPDAAMSRHKQQSAGGDKTLDLSHSNAKSVQQLQLNNVQIPNADDIVRMPEISERDTLAFDVEQLCRSIEADAQRRQRMAADVRQLREDRTEEEAAQKELLAQKRVAERTQILVENPEVNVLKMGDVLAASEARLGQLAMQWQAHRAQLVAELERANKTGVDVSTDSSWREALSLIDIVCNLLYKSLPAAVCWSNSASRGNAAPTCPPSSPPKWKRMHDCWPICKSTRNKRLAATITRRGFWRL